MTNTKYDCHGRTLNPNIFKFFENISHPTSIKKVITRFVFPGFPGFGESHVF